MTHAPTRLFFALAAAVVIFFSFAGFVAAQSESGITLRPARIEPERMVEPGTLLRYEIAVTNMSGTDQTYYLFVRDIVNAADNGAPIFATEASEITGYEVSEWVTLGTSEIFIQAGDTQSVEVAIDVPENATPGSHFGAVFASHEPPRFNSIGAAVGYQVGSIIHILIAGDVKEVGTIRSFSTGNYVYGALNIDFHARIENAGNTLITPFGPLEVYNMFGTQVATLTFNESRSGVFPGQTRDFELEWEGEGPGFGRYTADLSLIYGPQGRQQTMTNSLAFWVLPLNIIGPALGVLVVLLAIVYISVRVYVRRQLSMAGMSRRTVVRRRTNDTSAFLLVFVSMLTVTALFLILLLVLFA